MTVSLLSWLFVVAAGQGVFLMLCLLSSRQDSMLTANRLLAALVAVFVLIIGHAWMAMQGLFDAYPQAARAISALPLLIGPLLLLYLRSLMHGQKLQRRNLWHFLPFALALLAWLPFYLQPAAAIRAQLASPAPFPVYLSALGLIKAVHVCGYLLVSYRLIRHAEREQPGRPLLRGLHGLTLLLGTGLAVDALLFAAERSIAGFPELADGWGALVLIAFVYGLALLSMRMPLGYQPQPLETVAAKRPSVSLLGEDEKARFLADLTASMEQDHAYRDGELSLDQLAGRLALSAHELSQLINQSCGVNFQEYLNGYRVAALKRAMSDPEQAGMSILELALLAGFNSKSSMNRAFKKQTGLTPSQFRGLDAAA